MLLTTCCAKDQAFVCISDNTEGDDWGVMCCRIEKAQRCSAVHHAGSGHLVEFAIYGLVMPALRVKRWVAYLRSENSLLSHLGT